MFPHIGDKFQDSMSAPLLGQEPQRVEPSLKKAPGFSVSNFRNQLRNDMGMIANMLFGSAIEADRLMDGIARTKAVLVKGFDENGYLIDRPKYEEKLAGQKKELSGRVLMSIFVMPVTAILVAPILPLWGVLAIVNSINEGAYWKNSNQEEKKSKVDDWNVKIYPKPEETEKNN